MELITPDKNTLSEILNTEIKIYYAKLEDLSNINLDEYTLNCKGYNILSVIDNKLNIEFFTSKLLISSIVINNFEISIYDFYNMINSKEKEGK